MKIFKSLFAYITSFMLVGCLFYIESLFPTIEPKIFQTIRYILMGHLFVVSYNRKKMSLWIFSAMILGVEVGLDFPAFSMEMERFGKIFLRLIKSLVAPLIFATLVVGIAGHSNLKQLGRIGIKSILYFEIVTTIALFIGLAAINLSQAGVGVRQEASSKIMEKSSELLSQATEHKDHLVDIFPENIAKSIAENNVLQIVVFAVIFAIGLGMVKNKGHKETMLTFFEGLSEVMFKFTDIVMYLAPLAVFGALASTIAKSDIQILQNLLKLVGTLYIALIVFVLTVFLPIALAFKIPIKQFLQRIYEPVSLAFTTASSESALPIAMENLEKFGVSKKVVAFVIPTGYSFNLDGTTLYLSLATVFVAQMCGVDLSIGQQIGICFTLMLTSKGVAGVRGASFVILAGAVGNIEGLSAEKASVILAVDALMDMGRTSVNVLGNCLATVVIAKSEGEFDMNKAKLEYVEEHPNLLED
ncbi:MAG: cation:dicarboxylase symporter family transporter [Flavobacteriia bacterium]|nr:cation:dicarboxylase symporter family transporter [Flavobacteriia bacterium]